MPNAGYEADCDGCGTSGMVPGRGEEVVRGTLLRRTINDDYEEAALRAQFSGDVDERERAEARKEHVAKWEHYCPDCARVVGIA